MSRIFTEEELRGASLVWLVEVDFAGRIWRFASELATVEREGVSLLFDGVLDSVNFSDEAGRSTGDTSLPTADVALIFREDVARLVAQGHDLSAARAELSLWIKGSDYDDRRVLIEGGAALAQYGELGEPVSFSIEPDWLDVSSLYPPVDAVISAETWPTATDNAEGMVYPTILGAPGWGLKRPRSPVYVVEVAADTGLLAGHRVAASHVEVFDQLNNSTKLTVQHTTDGLGREVATVDLGWFPSGSARSFWAQWNEGDLDAPPNWLEAGGMLNPFLATGSRGWVTTDDQKTPPFIVGAGDVLRWALSLTGMRIDRGRTRAAAQRLNAFQLHGFVAEITDVMGWIRSEIAPLFSLAFAVGAKGLYPIVYDLDEEPVASITAGRDVEKAGQVEYIDNQIANEITLQWGYAVQTKTFLRRSSLTGDPAAQTSELLGRNAYTVASRSRHGPRALEVESQLVNDSATAAAIIARLSRIHATKGRQIKYTAPTSLGWLAVGDLITITDTSIHLEAQRAVVARIEWGLDALTLGLYLVGDAIYDTIPTT